MSDIQTKLRQYVNHDGGTVSNHSVLCFAGMLETGEATLADFEAAGIAIRRFVNRHEVGQLLSNAISFSERNQ